MDWFVELEFWWDGVGDVNVFELCVVGDVDVEDVVEGLVWWLFFFWCCVFFFEDYDGWCYWIVELGVEDWVVGFGGCVVEFVVGLN